MGLITRCPKCQSGFEVTSDQLRLHEGLVRCGQCSHVFDGFACLQAALPTLTRKVDAIPETEGSSTKPTLPSGVSGVSPAVVRNPRHWEADAEVSASRAPGEPVLKTGSLPSSSPIRSDSERVRQDREPVLSTLAGEKSGNSVGQVPIRVMGEARIRSEDLSSAARRDPDLMEDDREPSLLSRLFWGTGVVALGALLLVQLLVYFRDDLVTQMPWTRGALVQLCAPLGCEVSYVRRKDRIIIIGSSLQQTSGSLKGEQAYSLKLTLQNRNDYPQPWPSLLLSLSDASDTVLVRKVIPPEQYLPESIGTNPFGARQEMAIEIPITVSGFAISGFELQRFFP